MAKVMYVLDEPKTCVECPFHGKPEYAPDYDANDWLYRKIAECKNCPRINRRPLDGSALVM